METGSFALLVGGTGSTRPRFCARSSPRSARWRPQRRTRAFGEPYEAWRARLGSVHGLRGAGSENQIARRRVARVGVQAENLGVP
ncbi:MAG: hypothetical protein ACLSVD_05480 [Eggerthellaceae bacterium]